MTALLRVAVVQFAPKIGEVHANIAKARELCRGLTPRSVDLVCFPEMIFSGYMFPDAPSIAPYLEHPQTGPTATFCTELARHLQCHVIAGFPERLHLPTQSEPESHTNIIGANAALLVDGTGHTCHTYHKSNLFITDRTWARPGPGFTTVDLPSPLGRTAVAICNDVNVSNGCLWASIKEGPYELAEFCKREGVRVLLLLNAWLRPEDGGMQGVGEEGGGRGIRDAERGRGTGEENDDEDANSEGMREEEDSNEDALEPNWQVLQYWALRLRPLWAQGVKANARQHEAETSAAGIAQSRDSEEHDLVVVICNRTGHERGKVFVGSSAMFASSAKPRMLHAMGEREVGVSVWTAKLGSNTLAE